MRLTRAGAGHRYTHSCTGTFEISEDGRVITWDGVPGAPLDTVRMDVLARVLLLCVSSESVLCLHGSSVVTRGGAIAFLGHSGAGKTTLAMAVARAGALHLSDDTLPIALDDSPSVWAGDSTIRLCDDSASHFGTRAAERWRASDGKRVVFRPPLPDGSDRVPLTALYVVEPVRTDGASASDAVRHRLEGVAAVMMLIPHVRTAALARAGRSAALLDQVTRIVDRVPVYTVRIPRGWEHLDHVATTLLGWHGGAPALQGATG
jgi:hypothetical protein